MRKTSLFFILLLPLAATAQDSSQWWKPKGFYADGLVGNTVYLYDADVETSGLGYRLGAKWGIPIFPDAVKIRAGNFDLPKASYSFPSYSESNKHSAYRLDDIFDLMSGDPVRDGDRRQAGFSDQPFRLDWEPSGIEIGPEYSLQFQNGLTLGTHASIVLDLSSMPKVEGFEIEDDNLKRRSSYAWGLTLTNRLDSNFDVGFAYDRYVLTSYVTGKPQAWNALGDAYLYGRRSYNIVGVSLNYKWR